MRCSVRPAPSLGRRGFSAVVTCPPEVGVEGAVEFIRGVLGSDLVAVREEEERIGREYLLRKVVYSIVGIDGVVECRFVYRAGSLESLSCALPTVSVPSPTREPVLPKAPKRGKGMPPGQRVVKDFIIYAVLGKPVIDVNRWVLEVGGEVENALKLRYADLLSMPMKEIVTDFHCVTGWSVPSVRLRGVPTRVLAELSGVRNGVRWVKTFSADGYTTVIPLEDFLDEDALVVLEIDGKPLSHEQGFPARVFVPHLYGWKSGKWLTRIVFMREYEDGYWESLGYHERGNVWLEERFKSVTE